MESRFVRWWLVFVVVALTGPALAADKYVNCATGSDSNNGSSPSQAWKTIRKATTSANPGDIVHVSGTVTTPCVASNVGFGSRLTGPGANCRASEAQCTVFRGEPLSAPVPVVPESSGSDGFLIKEGVAHLKIQNFSFQPSGALKYNEPVKISGGSAHRPVSQGCERCREC